MILKVNMEWRRGNVQQEDVQEEDRARAIEGIKW